MTTLLIEHIVSLPDVFSGRPHIAGRRIGIDHIASHYNNSWSVEMICEQLELTPGEVHAALSYYFDHKEEVDQTAYEADHSARQIGVSLADLNRRIATSHSENESSTNGV